MVFNKIITDFFQSLRGKPTRQSDKLACIEYIVKKLVDNGLKPENYKPELANHVLDEISKNTNLLKYTTKINLLFAIKTTFDTLLTNEQPIELITQPITPNTQPQLELVEDDDQDPSMMLDLTAEDFAEKEYDEAFLNFLEIEDIND